MSRRDERETSSWGFDEGDEIVPGRTALRPLGGGRRYEAYLAWDDGLYAAVALKILRPALAADPPTLAALKGEARALAELDHPALVRSFDAVLEGERPHLVLEFLDGPRLSTLMRRYGVVVEQLLPLALELCAALHYLAGREYVHLDVKPRNIIMSAPPRLIDLSVARRVDELGEIKSPVGTDAYMAPEQCDPERFGEIGPPADVWGLGVVLHEALGRAHPFPAPDGSGAGPGRFPQLVRDPAPLPRDTPPALAAPLSSCLERVPGNRPSARELAAALEPFVAALPRPRLGLFRPGGRTRTSVFHLG